MNQRRRPSPAVYRRRRLVAALLAVLLLALVVWGGRALYDAVFDSDAQQEPSAAQTSPEPEQSTDDENASEPEPAASSNGEDEDSEEPVPEGYCAPSDIEVRAGTNHETYDTATAPLLIMEVENVGSQECTLDVGTAEQQFRVGSGGREVFTTAQCDLSGDSLEMEFEPGQSERAQMLWPRSDSAVDCSEPAELPPGDYELTVSVSGISSEPHSFEMAGSAG